MHLDHDFTVWWFRWGLADLVLPGPCQYFGHLMQRVDSLEKTLMLGGAGGRRRRGRQRMAGWMASPTQWTRVWVNSGSWWWTGRPGVLQFMGSQRVRHDWVTELNWTELNLCLHVSSQLGRWICWFQWGSLIVGLSFGNWVDMGPLFCLPQMASSLLFSVKYGYYPHFPTLATRTCCFYCLVLWRGKKKSSERGECYRQKSLELEEVTDIRGAFCFPLACSSWHLQTAQRRTEVTFASESGLTSKKY